MRAYSKIYDCALEDFKPHSDYEAMVVGLQGGIPDSQFFNWFDTKDIVKKNHKNEFYIEGRLK